MIGCAVALAVLAQAPLLPGGALLADHLPNVLEGVKVGEWVVYRFDDGSGRVYFWRIAVVGEQLDEKKRPAVFIELDLGQHPLMKAPMSQLKVLASRAQGLSAEGVTRAWAAMGADRPREIDPAELPRMLGRRDGLPPRPSTGDMAGANVRRGAATRLVTLGGTVTATPVELRFRDTVVKRFWLCDQIPILKLAKMELPAIAHSMEARDWGLDARPQMATPEPGAAKIRMEEYPGPGVP